MTKTGKNAPPARVPQGTRKPRKPPAGRADVSICERHLSPALRGLPAESLKIAPLTGIKALIYNSLWRPIADGRMKTGAMLAETDLEKLFAVSRTVIRPVLEHMAIEGCLVIPPHKSARVIEPTPDEAEAIFDVLGVVMRHIIGELADPAREITAGQRRMIELHLEAQGQADKAGDPIAAHLLGVEFLVLLAAIHGRVLFTDLIARTIVLETLSLKLYGEFPPPVFYVEFQSSLARAILAGKPQEALAEFDARLARIRGTLKFDTPAQYEEGDLTVLLGTKR